MARLVQQRRGHGSSNFRSPRNGTYQIDQYFRTPKQYPYRVCTITHEPSKNTPVAILESATGVRCRMVAIEGMYTGQILKSKQLQPGALVRLGDVPYGRAVCAIQNAPNGRVVYGRAAGVHATVVQSEPAYVVIRLNKRFIKLNPDCLAIYGIPAGSGRALKPILKAGTRIKMYRSKAKRAYSVSAKKKNICDHPFGASKSKTLGRKKCSARSAAPGAKVGNIAARRTGRK